MKRVLSLIEISLCTHCYTGRHASRPSDCALLKILLHKGVLDDVVSFASSSASLTNAMSSSPVSFLFEALILGAGGVLSVSLRSPSSSLSSFFALPRRARGTWSRYGGEGDWGQSRLKCPLHWQLKHLPSFMRRVRSSVVIRQARVRPGVVSMALGSLSACLLLNPCRHLLRSFFLDEDWSFLGLLTPKICRQRIYTSWCFRADSFHSFQESGLSISTQLRANGVGSPLMNFSRTVGSSTLYLAMVTYRSNLVMYSLMCPPSIRSFVSSLQALAWVMVSTKALPKWIIIWAHSQGLFGRT